MANKKLQVKHYILIALGFLIAAILVTSIVSALLLRQREIETWRHHLSNLTIVLSDQTNQTIASAQILLESIVDPINKMGIRNAAELRSKTKSAAMFQTLQDKISGLPYVDVAAIVDVNGDLINFTRSYPPKPINLADRDYFQAQRDNPAVGMYIGKTVKNKGNGKLVFYLSRRLNDINGQFIGIAHMGISVDQFTEFYEKLGLNLGEDTAISLYRRDFSLLARWPRNDDLIGKTNLTGTSYLVVEKMKKTDDVVYSSSPRFANQYANIGRLGAVRVVDRFPMILNLTVNEDFFLANWRHTAKTIAAMAVGSIIALLITGLFLVRTVRQRERSASLLRDLSEQVPGLLFQFQLLPDGQLNIPYVSHGAMEILGLNHEKLPIDVSKVSAGMHPDDKEKFESSIQESARSMLPWNEDFRMILPQKGVEWRHVDAIPQKLDNGTTLWHGYIADITERKRLEGIKGEFISIVSHELRTPLTSIRGALGLLTGMFSATLPDKAQELLKMANSNSERLTLMINDLLDLEKMDSGKFKLDFNILDIKKLTLQAISASEGYASQYQVHLKLLDVPENLNIRADENRLLQVFANLLSNAIKFSPEGGKVEISVRAKDGRVRISVRDFGQGIPASFRNRIFQRFSQADSSDTRIKGGTGLGLSITKAIIEQHGGLIDFISEEGSGAEFFFELPLSQDTAA